MTRPLLCVERLAAGYGPRIVLEDVSFELGGGALLSVLGRNGSGKSTLFRCLLGLLRPCGGRVTLDGADIAALDSQRRAKAFAYIPQGQPGVYAHSAFEVVLMGTTPRLGFLGIPGRREEERALRALSRIGIGHLAERPYNRLSGGERQMVLFARALAQDAGILVMDEPCSHLDYGNQIRVLCCARDLADQGYLVLFSTHNPDQALHFSDRTLILLEGRAERLGPPSEVLDSDVLERVYGVPLALHDLKGVGRVCVPRLRKSPSRTG